MAEKYPQEIYSLADCAVQLEWTFLQRVIKNKKQVFPGLGKKSRKPFCLVFYLEISKNFLPILGALSALPVTKFGVGLQHPVTSAKLKDNSLLHASCKLIVAVKGERDFSTADYIRAVKGKRWYGKNMKIL